MHQRLFYIFLILLPLQLGRHFWPSFSFVHGIRIDYLSPTVYLTDGILLGTLALWGFELRTHCPNGTMLHNIKRVLKEYWMLMGILFFLVLISTTAQVPSISFLRLIVFLKLSLLAIYIAHTKPNILISAYVLLISIIYSSVLAWAQFIEQKSVGGILWWIGERTFSVSTPGIATGIINGSLILRPYATFPHPNVLAGYIVALAPLMILIALQSNKYRHLKIPVSMLVLSTLIITLSRTAWFTMGIISGIYVWYLTTCKKTRTRVMHFATIPFLLIMGAMLVVFTPLMGSRIASLASSDREPITQRFVLNSAALSVIRNHPVVGVGLNNFIPSLPHYLSIKTHLDLQPAHNTYILIAAETGILGLGIVLYAIGHLFLIVWPHIIKKRPEPMALTISLLSICTLSLEDHYFYTIHQTQLLTAIIVGFILSYRKQS